MKANGKPTCSHCVTGFVYASSGQWVCLNCGWRDNPVVCPPEPEVIVMHHTKMAKARAAKTGSQSR